MAEEIFRKNRWHILIGTVGFVALAGCDFTGPSMPLHKADRPTTYTDPGKKPAPPENDRVTVTRIGTFEDDAAYNNMRGVYLIRDKATGQEFIGVSGIGISETGSHRSGKSTISDER